MSDNFTIAPDPLPVAFQESILTLVPAAIFILCAAPRAAYLLGFENKSKRQAMYLPKLAASCTLAALQVGLLGLTASTKLLNTRLSIGVAALNVFAAVCIIPISHIEHVKSIRPSFLLCAYLFFSALFDATRIRTEWLMGVNVEYASVLSASTACKVMLLSLESFEKRKLLLDKKAPSSESTSGPLSRGFFLWLNSLFFDGWKGKLSVADIPKINEKLESEKVAARFQSAWEKARFRKSKLRLFFATVNAIKGDLVFIIPPRVLLIGLQLSQPFLISHALRYLNSPDGEVSKNLGYGLIAAFALVFIGIAFLQAWYGHLISRTGATVRGGLIALIYPKMLRLPTANLSESSAVALMGNDVETLVTRLNDLLIEWWASSLTVAIAMWMLAVQLGAICVVPIIVSLISIALTSLVGKAMVNRLMSWQMVAGARINFTAQVISSIKSVKMLGFVEKFTSMVKEKRRDDIRSGRQFRWLIVADNAIGNMSGTQTHTIAFGAYAIVAKISGDVNFTAAQATVILAILNIMMEPLRGLLGAVSSALSSFATFNRLQDFLALEELTQFRVLHASDRKSASDQGVEGSLPSTYAVKISEGTFNWGQDEVIKGINAAFEANNKGCLTMIVGPIGSGKSSLLKSILGETSCFEGQVSVTATDIAFCDQTPWLMNATIRDNIVAQSGGFDGVWFNVVVRACDLQTDLDALEKGADTIVGDKGLKLSGGQKQRIAIARAVYSRKKIAIFDDVFSGFDKITERRIFSRVFAHNGLLRNNGTTVIVATHTDYVISLESGKVTQQGKYDDLRLNDGYVKQLSISEGSSSEAVEAPENEKREEEIRNIQDEAQAEGDVTPPSDRSVLKYYLGAIRMSNILLLAVLAGGSEAAVLIRYVWLTWWGDGRGRSSDDLGYWLGMFAMIGVLQDACVVAMIAMFLLVLGPVSGYLLHNQLLEAVMNATMSFLSNSDTGSLVNRFSQDMRLIDLDLPIALGVFVAQVCSCLGAAGLAIAAVSWFALSVPIVLFVMVAVQRFYIRTSKQLRILEIEHKAPLYSHFLQSINGLPTIRAFGWTSEYEQKNLNVLDDAQKPSYLMSCIQRWLALAMDLIVALLTVLLVTLAISLKGRFQPSLLGVALVNMMGMGGALQAIIIHWSMLETSLGAVSRVKHFSETTPSESSTSDDVTPSRKWPRSGSLVMEGLTVSYDEEPALRDVSLDLRPGERVGLCGRSGSGKSSIIQTILRTVDITSGQLKIDGKDVSTIPRNEIRKTMSCLTQDPFLFSDTIRFNMDPTGSYDDGAIVAALERVGIWEMICAKVESPNKLDEKMDETFLSHGQRQLFCLGRALLKKSYFLILDEPTSNVDKKTDDQMQEIIRTEFEGRTIIMIAHRLDTLLDFDRIVVLDQGRVVEVGAPRELLAKGGAFAKLYSASA